MLLRQLIVAPWIGIEITVIVKLIGPAARKLYRVQFLERHGAVYIQSKSGVIVFPWNIIIIEHQGIATVCGNTDIPFGIAALADKCSLYAVIFVKDGRRRLLARKPQSLPDSFDILISGII